MDFTQRFYEIRSQQSHAAVHDDTLLLAAQNEPDPAWIVKYQSVIIELDQINNMMKQISAKQDQKKLAHYQDALNEEILLMRGNLVKKLQNTTKSIKKYESVEIDAKDSEGRMFHKYIVKGLKSQMNTYLYEFKILQSQFLDSCQQKPKDITLDNLDDQSKNYYIQTQQQLNTDHQEVVTISKDINEIVDMVAQLATQIYECGTILDRIDQNLTQAEDYVEEGVENLKEALKTQDKVNYMRAITYFLILLNFILSIVMISLKVLMAPSNSGNKDNLAKT